MIRPSLITPRLVHTGRSFDGTEYQKIVIQYTDKKWEAFLRLAES